MRVILAAVMAALASAPAWGRGLHGEGAGLLAGPAQRCAEVPSVAGLTAAGDLPEVPASPAVGWIRLFVRPDGIACAVDAGTACQALPTPPPPPPGEEG